MTKAGTYAGVVVAVLVAWWALTVTPAVAPIVLPPIGSVAAALRVQVADPGTWARAMGVTTGRTAIAFLVATMVAVPLGILLGRSRLLTRAYEPLLGTAAAVPLVILYPVLAATLGLGTSSKVVLGGLYAFFPIAIATTRAVAQVDPTLVTAMRAMGAGTPHLVRTVLAPAALPGIVTGLRLGAGLALVTVIAAEFVAGASGVGYQLAAASQGYQSADLYGWVVLAVALAVVVNTTFTLLTAALERTIRR